MHNLVVSAAFHIPREKSALDKARANDELGRFWIDARSKLKKCHYLTDLAQVLDGSGKGAYAYVGHMFLQRHIICSGSANLLMLSSSVQSGHYVCKYCKNKVTFSKRAYCA